LISFSARTAPTHRCANAGCALVGAHTGLVLFFDTVYQNVSSRSAKRPTSRRARELSTTPRNVSCASSADYAWLPVIAWSTPCLQAVDGRARQQPVRVMRPEMASPRGGSFHGLATGLAAYSSYKVPRARCAHCRWRVPSSAIGACRIPSGSVSSVISIQSSRNRFRMTRSFFVHPLSVS